MSLYQMGIRAPVSSCVDDTCLPRDLLERFTSLFWLLSLPSFHPLPLRTCWRSYSPGVNGRDPTGHYLTGILSATATNPTGSQNPEAGSLRVSSWCLGVFLMKHVDFVFVETSCPTLSLACLLPGEIWLACCPPFAARGGLLES